MQDELACWVSLDGVLAYYFFGKGINTVYCEHNFTSYRKSQKLIKITFIPDATKIHWILLGSLETDLDRCKYLMFSPLIVSLWRPQAQHGFHKNIPDCSHTHWLIDKTGLQVHWTGQTDSLAVTKPNFGVRWKLSV